MPLRQYIVLALRRQFKRRQILRRGAHAGGNENHPLWVNGVNQADGFVIYAIQRRHIMIEFVGRLINEIEPQKRGCLTKIARDHAPPVDQILFMAGAGIGFIRIRLIGNNGYDAIVFAGLYQLTQMDEARFRRRACHTDTDMR
ncbi:hypothetical protein SEPB62_08229 [Salmonella enterica subsp. enterica serovar Paratyphi B str. SARA62]|nr:hypothetical protein SEPB62_08229 [Salmonella enterica subsp. enterica serovar Paratyphi B str. SARA62]ESF91428.1 hypothetical protein SEEPB585_05476 [Salmonella enterica subsp. enterica serovar Paratyphi B str. ATCC BAA-1585]